jgi:predicted nucleic-acid-binding Zn-ribbon protein
MKFESVKYSELKIKSTAGVKKSYITSIQNNKYQEVTISDEECKKSVRMLSRLRKKKK